MSEINLNYFWIILLTASLVLSKIFLYYTLFPASPAAEALKYFSKEQISKGQEYSKSLRLLFILSFLVKLVFLTWFIFSGVGEALSDLLLKTTDGSYYLSAAWFFIITWLIFQIIILPFRFYSGFILQHKWGFSTQSLASWWADYFKSTAIIFFLLLLGIIILFILMNNFTKYWWFIAGILCTVWLIAQIFLGQLFIAPLFNKFKYVDDLKIVKIVDNLSYKAGIPVKKVLEMDASRRTRKANAYVTGLGFSKRIVLYDNLVNYFSYEQIEAVLAHEMAHWKEKHITRSIIVNSLVIFLSLGVMYCALNFTLSKSFIINGSYPPITSAVIIYFYTIVSFLAMPMRNTASRAAEKKADVAAVELTSNKEAFIDLHKRLAVNNFSDVSPPKFIEWFSYSHPSTLNRIKNIEEIK